MATESNIGNRRRSRQWVLIAAMAIFAHLLLLLTVRQGFFDIFQRSVADTEGASSPRASLPQAIIVIPVEVESEEGEVVVEEPQEEPPRDEPSTEQRDGDDNDAVNILDVAGESQAPIPAEPGTRSAIVPPRPIEITWPETEKLGHCLGLDIDIRIRVDRDGGVLAVEPVSTDHPDDCTRAAIDAARRIRFRPGTADGKAQVMWTQIRIEFRRQRR